MSQRNAFYLIHSLLHPLHNNYVGEVNSAKEDNLRKLSVCLSDGTLLLARAGEGPWKS